MDYLEAAATEVKPEYRELVVGTVMEVGAGTGGELVDAMVEEAGLGVVMGNRVEAEAGALLGIPEDLNIMNQLRETAKVEQEVKNEQMEKIADLTIEDIKKELKDVNGSSDPVALPLVSQQGTQSEEVRYGLTLFCFI